MQTIGTGASVLHSAVKLQGREDLMPPCDGKQLQKMGGRRALSEGMGGDMCADTCSPT